MPDFHTIAFVAGCGLIGVAAAGALIIIIVASIHGVQAAIVLRHRPKEEWKCCEECYWQNEAGMPDPHHACGKYHLPVWTYPRHQSNGRWGLWRRCKDFKAEPTREEA